jgi:hypothetical protein
MGVVYNLDAVQAGLAARDAALVAKTRAAAREVAMQLVKSSATQQMNEDRTLTTQNATGGVDMMSYSLPHRAAPSNALQRNIQLYHDSILAIQIEAELESARMERLANEGIEEFVSRRQRRDGEEDYTG